jgi:hypothetical protein
VTGPSQHKFHDIQQRKEEKRTLLTQWMIVPLEQEQSFIVLTEKKRDLIDERNDFNG